jgi:hypothetical protein
VSKSVVNRYQIKTSLILANKLEFYTHSSDTRREPRKVFSFLRRPNLSPLFLYMRANNSEKDINFHLLIIYSVDWFSPPLTYVAAVDFVLSGTRFIYAAVTLLFCYIICAVCQVRARSRARIFRKQITRNCIKKNGWRGEGLISAFDFGAAAELRKHTHRLMYD